MAIVFILAVKQVRKGPRSKLGDHPSVKKAFRSIMQQLASCHPLLSPPTDVDFLQDSGLCIAWRNVCTKGSLRDLLHSSKWQDNFDFKYRKAGKPFSEEKISKYGRQILFSLLWLESSGIPYTHLHSGNVLVDKDVCFLSDLELPFLAVPRHYEQVFQEFTLKYPRAAALVDLNVISFAALLFEISVGRDMTSLAELDYYPQWASPNVKTLLQRILRPNGDALVPTIAELYNDPVFASAPDPIKVQPPPIKFDDVVEKELIKHATKLNSKALDDPRNKDGPDARRSGLSKSKSRKAKTLSTAGVSSPRASSSSTSLASTPTKVSSAAPAAPPPRSSSSASVPAPPPPPPRTDLGEKPTALLSSITAFNPSKLKKAVTNDRSAPIV
jgi:PX domain-containing protein kinase-like protein